MNFLELLQVYSYQIAGESNEDYKKGVFIGKPKENRFESPNLLNNQDSNWEPEEIVSICENIIDRTGQKSISHATLMDNAQTISAIRNEVVEMSYHPQLSVLRYDMKR